MEVLALCVTGRTRRAGPPWEELCPRHRSAAPAPLPWLPPSVCTDPPPGTRARRVAAAPAPYFAEYPFLMKHAVDVISVDTLLGLRPVLLGLGPGAPSCVTPWLLCSQAPAVSTSRIMSALRVPARRPRLPRGRHRYVTSPAVLSDQTLEGRDGCLALLVPTTPVQRARMAPGTRDAAVGKTGALAARVNSRRQRGARRIHQDMPACRGVGQGSSGARHSGTWVTRSQHVAR